MSAEARPNSAGRGYGGAWPKRAAAHLERVRREQEAAGWPGGPWCECKACSFETLVGTAVPGAADDEGGSLPLKADTVDHRRPRRLFPIELQGSAAPGGSDHPSNLRAMAHSHHSRRADDKKRRRT